MLLPHFQLNIKLNIYLLLFIIIFSLSLILKLLPILNYSFPFTMDQGRDMLEIRSIVVGKNPTLIGPTTSINGVFLGPFWYYFNSIPFIIGQGNPAVLVYWQIFWFQIAALSLWFVNRKKPLFALCLSSLFMMSPALFYASRYSWNANTMPIFTTFFFILLIACLRQPAIVKLAALGILNGLSFQLEAAFAILLPPFAILLFLVRKLKLKNILSYIAGFTITLLPQIIFEFRNNFLMTNNFLNELTGKTTVLSDKLGPAELFLNHLFSFHQIFLGVIQVPGLIIYSIVIISVILLLFKLQQNQLEGYLKDYFIVPILFIPFAFLFYLLYPYPLKGWFIISLAIPLIFIIASFLTQILLQKDTLRLITVLVVLMIMFSTVSTQLKLIPVNGPNDPSALKNELTAIDWVYQKAENRPFKVYNYIPSVYDYPYQYLFWWHGAEKYNYQPDTVTYLDNVPEYIPDNLSYFNKRKPANQKDPIFLIVERNQERPERRYAWLGNFTRLCLEEKHEFSWKTEVYLLYNVNQCSRPEGL